MTPFFTSPNISIAESSKKTIAYPAYCTNRMAAPHPWLYRPGKGIGSHERTAGRDVDPRMSDKDILDWAVREQRLVLTQDKDFGELVYLSGQAHAGVLLLRLEDAAVVPCCLEPALHNLTHTHIHQKFQGPVHRAPTGY